MNRNQSSEIQPKHDPNFKAAEAAVEIRYAAKALKADAAIELIQSQQDILLCTLGWIAERRATPEDGNAERIKDFEKGLHMLLAELEKARRTTAFICGCYKVITESMDECAYALEQLNERLK